MCFFSSSKDSFGFAYGYIYWYSYYWLYGTDYKHVSDDNEENQMRILLKRNVFLKFEFS